MTQFIAHLIGDYLLQSHWMALNKTKDSRAALAHAITYGLPFLFLTFSPFALIFIVGTHFLIDRYRLARYVVYAKNFLAPSSEIWKYKPHDVMAFEPDEFKDQYKWENCQATGYPADVPAWLSTWLLIIADNCIHLFCNYLALKYM